MNGGRSQETLRLHGYSCLANMMIGLATAILDLFHRSVSVRGLAVLATPLGPALVTQLEYAGKCVVYVVRLRYPFAMPHELKSIRLQMVIAPSQVTEIDAWRKNQEDLPSRSEAIRRLIDLGLKKSEKDLKK